jgi:AraC family transcriptional regulator
MDLCRLTLDTPLPRQGVQRAKALIARRLGDPDLDLQALANEAGLSRYHFLRKFKQETGQTPVGYLRDKRLLRAMDLLTLSDLSVKRIAGMCGYRRSAHFCAAFRDRFGLTPGSIRKG